MSVTDKELSDFIDGASGEELDALQIKAGVCLRCLKTECHALVKVRFGGEVLGIVCESCEEEVMTELSKKVPRAEGRRGLKLWRKERDRRRQERAKGMM